MFENDFNFFGHVFGVKYFIIAMNKMDSPSVAYSEYVFNGMMERVQEIMNKTNIEHYCILPLSTLNGDNIGMKSVNYYNDKMEWFDGLTLKEIIGNIKPQRNEGGTLLLSVTSTNCRNEVVFGMMIIGIFNAGDNIIIFLPENKAEIESMDRHSDRLNEENVRWMRRMITSGLRFSIFTRIVLFDSLSSSALKRGDIVHCKASPFSSNHDVLFHFVTCTNKNF